MNNYFDILEEGKKKIDWKKWINFTFAGILLAFVTNYLIIYVEIFSPGLGGISQGFSYLFNGYILGSPSETKKITIYWLVYIAFNIPIIWFAYLKFGWKFVNYSGYVLIINLIFSLIFAYFPGFKDIGFFDIERLENASSLIQFITYCLIAIISGVIYGFAVGLTFKNSGSSLGFDPIIKWLSNNKNVEISKLMFTIAIVNTISWTFLYAILDNSINSFDTFLQTLFNPKIFASILYFLCLSIVTTIIYPSKTKILIEINSTKTDEISYFLNKMSYHRNHTILKVEGGYTHKPRKIIQAIVAHDEEADILKIIEKIDPNAFIFTSRLKGIYGNFVSKATTLEEIEWNKKRANKAKKKKEKKEKD